MPDPSENRDRPVYSFTQRVLITAGISAVVILLTLLIWRSLTVLLMIFAGFLFSLILRWIKDYISRYSRAPPIAALILALILVLGIPNLGPVLAFIPALLVALSEGMMKALYVSIFYLIVQNIEGNFLTPMIQRKFIHVPPVLILSIQVLLMTLIGFLGILLAMPLLACIMVLVQMLYVEDVLGDRMDRPVDQLP